MGVTGVQTCALPIYTLDARIRTLRAEGLGAREIAARLARESGRTRREVYQRVVALGGSGGGCAKPRRLGDAALSPRGRGRGATGPRRGGERRGGPARGGPRPPAP